MTDIAILCAIAFMSALWCAGIGLLACLAAAVWCAACAWELLVALHDGVAVVLVLRGGEGEAA